MTKTITIKLTEDQINRLLTIIWEYNNLADNLTEKDNSFTERLWRKLSKALAKAKTV